MLNMDHISRSVAALTNELIALRRDFHQHPELGFEELRTAGIVATHLKQLNLAVRTSVGGTGVVAILDSGRAGKTVLARADMDALPIQEERDSPYRSTIAGKMHACGHDGHTAVLLTAANLLTRTKDELEGKIVFVFQPAEELGKGAEAMLKDGALEGLSVDHAIGLHLSSTFPTGTVAARSGPAMAGGDNFRLLVHGRGGHAAKPHEVIDPVLAAAQIVTTLQALVAREIDPNDRAVISVTSIRGGTAYNIIPKTVELKGTVRTLEENTRTRLRQRITEVATGVCASLRTTLESDWFMGLPAVFNDESTTPRLRNVAAGVAGITQVVEPDPFMAGEDMALWLKAAPGTFFHVGARNGATGIDKPHHHPEFDIDEAALPLALEVLCRGVLEFLR
ncbi:MAG: amidohydrolase [Trueperaceae bacterium]|nr:MAG: amidohydrolase [Trueperaceae bacterium]